jgi:protein transport protein SEC61 subunit gamma-like protein
MAKFSTKMKNTYGKYKRVWRLLKKPSMKEFKLISKVTAIGILIIGVLGFLISLVMNMFF